MSKTNGNYTPGGSPALQENPLFSETDPTDSGEGQTLQNDNNAMYLDNSTNKQSMEISKDEAFQTSRRILKSPILPRSNSMDGIPKTFQHNFEKPQGFGYTSKNNFSQLALQIEKSNTLIKALEAELRTARNEIKVLKLMNEKDKPSQNYYSQLDSDEEEDIVAKETEWLLQKPKKRKRSQEKENTKAIEAIVEITNKKPTSSGKNSTSQKTDEKKAKKLNPPPVIISNMEDYNVIKQSMQEKNLQFKANLMNNNQLKINADSETDYRNITTFLNESQREWHTYENKQTRPIRVMARNLHHSCTPEEITDELTNNGFKIINVVNMIKKTKDARIPLSLFLLTFDNSEDIKKIYEIKYICYMRVKIEAVKSNNLIPQCKRCQRYGHTKKFCQREPQCVRCAGKHLTANCDKPKTTPAKCSNCAEAHPASYRGCLVAKELQKRRINKNVQSVQPPVTTQHVRSGVSFAEITKPNENSQSHNPKSTDYHTILQMLQNVMNAVNKLSERLDRVEGTNGALIY